MFARRKQTRRSYSLTADSPVYTLSNSESMAVDSRTAVAAAASALKKSPSATGLAPISSSSRRTSSLLSATSSGPSSGYSSGPASSGRTFSLRGPQPRTMSITSGTGSVVSGNTESRMASRTFRTSTIQQKPQQMKQKQKTTRAFSFSSLTSLTKRRSASITSEATLNDEDYVRSYIGTGMDKRSPQMVQHADFQEFEATIEVPPSSFEPEVVQVDQRPIRSSLRASSLTLEKSRGNPAGQSKIVMTKTTDLKEFAKSWKKRDSNVQSSSGQSAGSAGLRMNGPRSRSSFSSSQRANSLSAVPSSFSTVQGRKLNRGLGAITEESETGSNVNLALRSAVVRGKPSVVKQAPRKSAQPVLRPKEAAPVAKPVKTAVKPVVKQPISTVSTPKETKSAVKPVKSALRRSPTMESTDSEEKEVFVDAPESPEQMESMAVHAKAAANAASSASKARRVNGGVSNGSILTKTESRRSAKPRFAANVEEIPAKSVYTSEKSVNSATGVFKSSLRSQRSESKLNGGFERKTQYLASESVNVPDISDAASIDSSSSFRRTNARYAGPEAESGSSDLLAAYPQPRREKPKKSKLRSFKKLFSRS